MGNRQLALLSGKRGSIVAIVVGGRHDSVEVRQYDTIVLAQSDDLLQSIDCPQLEASQDASQRVIVTEFLESLRNHHKPRKCSGTSIVAGLA